MWWGLMRTWLIGWCVFGAGCAGVASSFEGNEPEPAPKEIEAPVAARGFKAKLCVDYKPDYEDGGPEGGDDHLKDRPLSIDAIGAQFALVKSADGSLVWSGFLAETDGCTPLIEVESAVTYKAVLSASAKIRSNTIVLGGEIPQSKEWPELTFDKPGDYPLVAEDSVMTRVLAAISYGLFHRSAGVKDQTIEILGKPMMADPCKGTSCNSGGKINFVVDPRRPGSDHSRYKNVLLHELGHRVMLLGSGLQSSEFRRATNAPGFGRCPGGDGHRRNGAEWQSIAIAEGFAHFYASLVLNDPGQGDCEAYSHYEVDWDLDGKTDGKHYSCDGPPVRGRGLAAGDYIGTACGGNPPPGTASEYDYQRFFWDLVDKEKMSLRDIVDIIGDANRPTPWNATYEPLSPDNPRNRLAAAARAKGFGDAWERQASENGVGR